MINILKTTSYNNLILKLVLFLLIVGTATYLTLSDEASPAIEKTESSGKIISVVEEYGFFKSYSIVATETGAYPVDSGGAWKKGGDTIIETRKKNARLLCYADRTGCKKISFE